MEEIKRRINALFDSGLKGEALVIALEKEIKNVMPYNHDAGHPMDACNIKSNIELKVIGHGRVSQIVEKIESSITKRKMAFMLFKKIIEKEEGVEESENSLGIREESYEKGFPTIEGSDKSDMESLVRTLLGYDKDIHDSKNPNNCNETDDSECWSCKHNKNCKRKDSF